MKKLYNQIGLAQKGRMVSSGTLAAKSSLISKKAQLLIMSADISVHTRESLVSLCQKMKKPFIIQGDKYDLGKAVGKAYRVAITINNEGMARAVLREYEAMGEEKSTEVDKWPK